MKNCSEKSIILAPFNSTQSEDIEVFKKRIKPMIMEKAVVLRLSRLCREIDRQYEFNNNGQLDNGVYHKQLNNSAEDAKKGDAGPSAAANPATKPEDPRARPLANDRNNGRPPQSAMQAQREAAEKKRRENAAAYVQ